MWPCLRDPWAVGTNDNPLCKRGGQDWSSLSLLSITPHSHLKDLPMS